MPRVEVDFEAIDKPIDKGTYLAEIFGATPKTSKNDGSLMVVIDWVIIEKGDFCDRQVTQWLTLMDQKKKDDGTPDKEAMRRANYFVREFMNAVKAPYETNGFNTEDLMHKKAMIEVKPDEYEGRPTTKIVKVHPLTDDILAQLGMQ